MVVTAHVAASGALPSVGALTVAGAMAALVGVAFSGRRLSWRRSFAVLLLLQPLLHVTLMALGTNAHDHHSAGEMSASWSMIGAHVVAAAAAATWVAMGDRLLSSVATAVGARLGIRTIPVVPLDRLVLPGATGDEADHRASTAALLGALTRRGPPRACTA